MVEEQTEPSGERQNRILMSRFLDDFAQGKPDEVVAGWDRTGNLAIVMPEVTAQKGVEQSPEYHQEGNVWEHVIRSLRCAPSDASLNFKMALLLHDIGKTSTTIRRDDGRITSNDHHKVGAEMAGKIIDRFSACSPEVSLDKNKIVYLVRYHLVGQGFGVRKLRQSTIERHFLGEYCDDLLALIKADILGRDTPAAQNNRDDYNQLVRTVTRLRAEKKREPKPMLPILNGNEIIDIFCIRPSPLVGQIREALRELHVTLGFVDKGKSRQAAVFLRDVLQLEPSSQEISPKALQLGIKKTTSLMRLQLQQEVICALSDSEQQVRYELNKAKALSLMGEKIRVLFLGPPLSGKTSFLHSLAAYMEELISELPFKLAIQKVDLDMSRSDLSLLEGEATWLRGRKLGWTIPLAQKAARNLRSRGGNIIFADGPGGKPDEITTIISRPVHCAILIADGTTDDGYRFEVGPYKDFLDGLCIPVIAEFHSRPKGQIDISGEDVKSKLRSFNPEQFIEGQVVGLMFGERNLDHVIKDAAKALLFSILPAFVGRRSQKSMN